VVATWNKVIDSLGIDFKLVLPHKAFNRKIGDYAEYSVIPASDIIDKASWNDRKQEWLPSSEDQE
jgi:benzoyl-CoA 2,3-dioxygenase component B